MVTTSRGRELDAAYAVLPRCHRRLHALDRERRAVLERLEILDRAIGDLAGLIAMIMDVIEEAP